MTDETSYEDEQLLQSSFEMVDKFSFVCYACVSVLHVLHVLRVTF